MGEAVGWFSYVEDLDGIFIEFVEIYKVLVMKKLGWYFNLKKCKFIKLFFCWVIKVMGLLWVME